MAMKIWMRAVNTEYLCYSSYQDGLGECSLSTFVVGVVVVAPFGGRLDSLCKMEGLNKKDRTNKSKNLVSYCRLGCFDSRFVFVEVGDNVMDFRFRTS